MSPTRDRNLEIWEQHGSSILPVMPFLDNVVVRSEGSYLIDREGKRILDLAAGQFCTILGHNHPRFIERLVAELRNNLHTGSQYLTERVFEAAQAILGIVPPGLDKVTLLSTGSEANEFALRIAKAFTGRTGVIGIDRGYYGISLATRSLSAISDGHVDLSPKIPGSFHVMAPNCARCPLGLTYPQCAVRCLDVSMRAIGSNVENVAAIIVETVVSAGGMIFPHAEFFERLRKLADDIGALLIVDEAQTGFGRCGAWFDCENLGIRPDILVFSKTSGNGYPSSGVVVPARIVEKLLDQGFHHLSSHQNDPVTAAAILAVIEIIRSENLLERARENGAYFLERLRELEARHPRVWGVRGRGLMIAFELVIDRESLQPDVENLTPFVLGCQARGVHVTYSYYEGAIRIIPGLNLSREEIDIAIDVFDATLTDLEQNRLDSSRFANTNPVIRSMTERSKLRRTMRRLWETSPSYWWQRIRQRRAT
jgi:2,2-dialkylglycine decarboxylase (pyruvate)